MPNLSLTISFHPTAKHADVSIDSETLVKDAVELFKLLDRHESTERGLYLPRTAPQCSAGALDLYLDPSRTLASYRLVDKVRCAIVVAAISIRLTHPRPHHTYSKSSCSSMFLCLSPSCAPRSSTSIRPPRYARTLLRSLLSSIPSSPSIRPSRLVSSL